MAGGDPRPGDDEMWAAVEATVRDVLLPEISDEWARAAAVQLVGLARYAMDRPPDPSPTREADLEAALDGLAAGANPIVAAVWPDRGLGVHHAVARSLAGAVGRDDHPATEIRMVLRPLVVSQLDEELEATGPLLDYFRGRLPDA